MTRWKVLLEGETGFRHSTIVWNAPDPAAAKRIAKIGYPDDTPLAAEPIAVPAAGDELDLRAQWGDR
jgi:hypothetical protein